jgi:hypothetical protein
MYDTSFRLLLSIRKLYVPMYVYSNIFDRKICTTRLNVSYMHMHPNTYFHIFYIYLLVHVCVNIIIDVSISMHAFLTRMQDIIDTDFQTGKSHLGNYFLTE